MTSCSQTTVDPDNLPTVEIPVPFTFPSKFPVNVLEERLSTLNELIDSDPSIKTLLRRLQFL